MVEKNLKIESGIMQTKKFLANIVSSKEFCKRGFRFI